MSIDKSQDPGVKLTAVQLLSCVVAMKDLTAPLNYTLAITDIVRRPISDQNLEVEVEFDLMRGIPNAPCDFTFRYVAKYQRKSDSPMDWDTLKNHIVVAHLVTFAREFISNITSRMPVLQLMIEPTNTHRLVERYQKLVSAKAESAHEPSATTPAV